VTITPAEGITAVAVVASRCRSSGIASQVSPAWIHRVSGDACNTNGIVYSAKCHDEEHRE